MQRERLETNDLVAIDALMTTPGWYPDPGGSSAARYWNGAQWTPQLRALEATHALRDHPARGNRLIYLLTGALAVVLGLLVVGVIALLRSGDQPAEPGASPSMSRQAALTGTSDDWLASVCEPGQYMDGTLADALTAGVCASRGDDSHLRIGSFASAFAAENAAAMYTQDGGSYATGTDSTGTVWLFISSTRDTGETLAPLRRFGFTIH